VSFGASRAQAILRVTSEKLTAPKPHAPRKRAKACERVETPNNAFVSSTTRRAEQARTASAPSVPLLLEKALIIHLLYLGVIRGLYWRITTPVPVFARFLLTRQNEPLNIRRVGCTVRWMSQGHLRRRFFGVSRDKDESPAITGARVEASVAVRTPRGRDIHRQFPGSDSASDPRPEKAGSTLPGQRTVPRLLCPLLSGQ